MKCQHEKQSYKAKPHDATCRSLDSALKVPNAVESAFVGSFLIIYPLKFTRSINERFPVFLHTVSHFLKMLMDSNKHLSKDESALIPAPKVTEMSYGGIST